MKHPTYNNTMLSNNTRSSNGFMLFEVALALLIISVAFGIFVHFYLARNTTLQFPIAELDIAQEQAFNELESKLSPTPHKVFGTNGEFCEGVLFQSTQPTSVFKMFEPKDCTKSSNAP